jgi:hypothetical protein
MKVEIKFDSTDICPYLYEGSVLQNVRETKKNYIGIFSSFAGSYEVKVPKNRAKILKNESNT